MDQAEFQQALAEQERRLRAEFEREKPWWRDRIAAVKNDPQTAALCTIAGFAAAKWGGTITALVAKVLA